MISKISKIYNKILETIKTQLGCIIFIIFVIIVLYTGWLLYRFVYKPVIALPKASFERITINRKVFDRVIEQINLREKIFFETSEKEYKNIFK